MENSKVSNKKGNENPPPTYETQNFLNLMEAEASTNDNEKSGGNHHPPSPPPPPPIVVGEGQSGGGGGWMAISADGDGGDIVGNVGSLVVGAGAAAKKKRDCGPKNPPPGIPTCPVCHRTFANWKGAFGHMRKHPERQYRGFFKPPTFSSSSSKPNHGSSGVESGGSAAAATSTVRGNNVEFDLNVTPSEVNTVGFDLNQFPQTDDDEQQHQE